MARAHCAIVTYDPVTNTVMTSATVNVYAPGTVTAITAAMFDRNGNVLSNPLTSDATTGLVDFYLNVAQEVDLVVSKTGFNTRTYSNVPVLDDASNNLTALLTTTGDIPYASSANTPARLPIGGTGALLNVSGGAPAWLAVGANNTILNVSGGAPAWTATPTLTSLAVTTITAVSTLTSSSANPATAGVIRLANGDAIEWRNGGGTGNDYLLFDGSDRLNLSGAATAATATAGVNGAPPAQVATYLTIVLNGTVQKIPCYNS